MNYFIYLITLVVILYEFYLLFNNLIYNIDKIIIIISIILQLLFYINIFFKINKLFKLIHYSFWILTIYIILISKNIYLLLLTLINVLSILFTRYYYKECLFYNLYSVKDKNNINKFWDKVTILLLIIILFKIFVNINQLLY
jgi:hypothetical protein